MMVAFIAGVTISVCYFLCLFGETIRANSTEDPPPNKFQWGAANECFRVHYMPWLGPSSD